MFIMYVFIRRAFKRIRLSVFLDTYDWLFILHLFVISSLCLMMFIILVALSQARFFISGLGEMF